MPFKYSKLLTVSHNQKQYNSSNSTENHPKSRSTFYCKEGLQIWRGISVGRPICSVKSCFLYRFATSRPFPFNESPSSSIPLWSVPITARIFCSLIAHNNQLFLITGLTILFASDLNSSLMINTD